MKFIVFNETTANIYQTFSVSNCCETLYNLTPSLKKEHQTQYITSKNLQCFILGPAAVVVATLKQIKTLASRLN